MSKLKAGAAKVCIDPTPDMFPMPRTWGVFIEDIYSSVYIRALAVQNEEETFAMLVFEAGNGTDELKEKVSARYGIPVKNLLFCETHNHGTAKPGPPNDLATRGDYSGLERWGEMIQQKAEEAVGQALAALRPARYGYGEGKSYINVNRDLQLEDGSWAQADNWEGPSDKALAVLKLVDQEGNLIAAVLNHCTHANTTFLGVDADGKTKLCGDFPGFTCDWLETHYGGGAVVLWTSGAAGNQNAVQAYRGDIHYVGEETVNYSAPHGLSYRYAQYLGEIHAVDALKALRVIDCDRDSMVLRSAVMDIHFPGQKPPEGVNFSLQILKAQNAIRLVDRLHPGLVQDGKILNRSLPPYSPSGELLPCEMQVFQLGDVAIVTAAAELYNELGTLIKEHAPLRNCFVITNTGGHGNRVGYIQDDASSTRPTFQHFDKVYPGGSNKIVLDGARALFSEIFA